LALALALHIGLGLLIFLGWRSHSIKSEDDAAPAQVGLWTAADIAHAAKTPELPKAQPKPKNETQPQRPKRNQEAAPDEEADIHLGQTKPHKKNQATPVPTATPKSKPTHKPTAEPTEKPKAKPSPAPTHKPTAKPTPDPRIEQERQRQDKAKAEKLTKEKALEKERQETIKSMMIDSKNAGAAGGSTTSAHNGMGKSPYKPSNDYLARISAIIKRNTHFDANSLDGNPVVKIEIRLSPDGTILGKPRVLRSSGNPDWDAAAVEGIERAERLPRDLNLGTAPPIMVIDRRPKD
jgi:colicin import membrane protein